MGGAEPDAGVRLIGSLQPSDPRPHLPEGW